MPEAGARTHRMLTALRLQACSRLVYKHPLPNWATDPLGQLSFQDLGQHRRLYRA